MLNAEAISGEKNLRRTPGDAHPMPAALTVLEQKKPWLAFASVIRYH